MRPAISTPRSLARALLMDVLAVSSAVRRLSISAAISSGPDVPASAA
ncbi:hypothetical protein H2O14_09210 [Rhizobium sp. G21]|nr:hypothetical protein [Rhizobium sp. G21]